MKYKIFLSAVFVTIACSSLHAKEGVTSAVYYGNVDIAGKEYIIDTGESGANSCHCGLDPQSPAIYIDRNTKIYDKDAHSLFTNQIRSEKNFKKTAKIKEEASSSSPSPPPLPPPVIFSAIPSTPSSSAILQGGKESATVPTDRRHDKPLPAVKTYKENIFRDINNSDLSLYLPEQRQKLSPAAIQCGMLTSFGSNYPPV